MEPELPKITVILPEHQIPFSQMVQQTSRLLSYHVYPPLPELCLSFICKTGKMQKICFDKTKQR